MAMPIQVLACTIIFLAPIVRAANPDSPTSDPLAWPPITIENKPWARWWWLGSAVDETNLTRLLEQYHDAGIGGVEICPIYGAKGYEDRYIDFLSPKWMKMLAHVTSEGKRLGIGVDLTTGTGWPFGGPGVPADIASCKVVLKAFDTEGGARSNEKLPDGRVQCIRAVSADGRQLDLTDDANDGRLDWTPPAGKWRVYVVCASAPIQKVKRAAPGGEGNVLDPYSVAAMDNYLATFDRAFADFSAPMPRSEFHDSFEYYGATWTSGFIGEFQRRRGYDLREHLPALFGDGEADTLARVKGDYRETIADLHLAYIDRWAKWSHDRGSLARNQAHGAPGNLLDLYAAADIPETEIFGATDDRAIPLHKMASSAAHITGRALASSESFTWFGEHFQVSLADIKPAADFLFLCGINHIFFHGIPYSPQDAPWPGWLFYASVNFGPEGGLWRDLPAFNAYIARCQSILQSGKPDNDVLLYWPVHDTWQSSAGLTTQFTVHDQSKWLWSTPFYTAAMDLWKHGYTFDEVSDRLLTQAKCVDGRIRLGGNSYRAIVIPKCQLIPVATMKKLIELAQAGATVIVQGTLPVDVPGLGDLQRRRDELAVVKEQIKPIVDRFIVGLDAPLDQLLAQAGVPREPMVDQGLQFIRREGEPRRGHDYFIVNRGQERVDGWVPLAAAPIGSAVILDPRFDDHVGVAALRHDKAAGGLAQIYLQLDPGESRIVRTFSDPNAVSGAKRWTYFKLASAGDIRAITGKWRVHFAQGGPKLPADFATGQLASWAALGDDEARRFAGAARYTIEFERPAEQVDDWMLDLGRVCESARVKLNAHEVGTLWCAPMQIRVGRFLRAGNNVLEVEVTNLAANRIADLDRRGVNWKSFHEINFVNRDYKPFDASRWPPRDSGLIGPVRLIPMKELHPNATSGDAR